MTEAGPGHHRYGSAVEVADAAEHSSEPAHLPGSGASLDRQLISEIYREHGLDLVRVALLLVGDKATAEDVVQDAFIGLVRGLHRLADTDKALAYLHVSVINGCRSVHRTRRRASLRRIQPEPAVWSAESAVMAREDSRLALQAVSRLPARAREILALRYYLDMPDQEIAAVLKVSRGTVSSTASRALASLAQVLREQL
ncbi:MAG TPA: sigma-70 family RNA polymerase sigma factor [Streptosporangiaceae bacterium]|nr:sigma-70 family RNA polymerase sigma factor [Streptosporangiaceae bacterium]